MPYKAGSRLGAERASKLGHLDVVRNEHVRELVEAFESDIEPPEPLGLAWEPYQEKGEPLPMVFAVDGSLSYISSEAQPFKEVAFVKTALLRLDQSAIAKIDKHDPHPFALRDVMADCALYHATVFPLKNISLPGQSTYHAVRRIIFDSLKDEALHGMAMETLKWIAYEKWDGVKKYSPSFECPHCGNESKGLPYDQERGECSSCGEEVLLSDMIGFHLEMAEDGACSPSVATSYMLIHETLLLFYGIMRYYQAGRKDLLARCLFIKDGPLTLRSQYSKLVIPIRRFFEFAKKDGAEIHLFGQEKTGTFVDHLELIARHAPSKSYFLPDNEYIRREVQQQPRRSEPYGKRTNYGNKLFLKTDPYHWMVLNVPVGDYADSKHLNQLIGIQRILDSLGSLVSFRHESALVPIELVNGIASLSTYPSSSVLKVFAGVN